MEVREPMAVYGRMKLTIEEYLEWEDAQLEKHEYYQGEVFAMAGASEPHNFNYRNLYVPLAIKQKGKPCQPFGSDMRVHIPENTLFTYPDIAVMCRNIMHEKPEYLASYTNPIVIVEILSRSTRNYDQGAKFRLYQDIQTLKEYVLVDSESIHAIVYRKNNAGEWEREEYKEPEQIMEIKCLDFSVSIADVYEDVAIN